MIDTRSNPVDAGFEDGYGDAFASAVRRDEGNLFGEF
jgi:hypothetical protein